MSSGRAASRGFSLLELLVAFAIMALAIGLIYRATGGAVRNVATIEDRQRALWLAEGVMSQVNGVPERGLYMDGQAQEFRWSLRTTPYEGGIMAPDAPHLHEVIVTVGWNAGSEVKQLELTGLKPEKAAPVPRRS